MCRGVGRARYRSVDWGAMMFIASDAPRWRDGAKLREWMLLGVRMAAVGLPVYFLWKGRGAAGAS